MDTDNEIKLIKRLSTTLPDPLALYVGTITGEGGDYETPSEFVRDLIRRHMECSRAQEKQDVETLLMRSLAENNYSPWTPEDTKKLYDAAED